MDKSFYTPQFPVSEKIYRFLLRAYPRKHRTAYGAMMEQLFRDQCRDAWNGSNFFGLLKLWSRILPELVNTSIIERIAVLKEGKTMNEKLARLAVFGGSSQGIFIRVFVPVFLLIVAITTAITFILPESFASTARVKIRPSGSAANANSFDPYYFQTQLEIIGSEVVLEPVIAKLHLNETWGKKYFNGQTFKNDESLKILNGRIQIAPVRNTQIANITVYGDDSREAAAIANAIAESYCHLQISELKPNRYQIDPIQKNGVPQPLLGQIIDIAQPSLFPVKPNRLLNICLGVVVGGLIASFCGALAVWLACAIRKQRPASPAQT